MTSHETDRAAAFEELRPRLVRVAYATLGSFAEAEDVVQDAWLRLQRTEPGDVRDLRAWLTTVVGRLALDALGSARARRERYVGEWLPEPLVGEEADPADRVTLDEEVSLAMLRCSSPCRRPSGRRSCCTTSSGTRSTRWPRPWAARLRRRGSSPRARGATWSPGARASRPVARLPELETLPLRPAAGDGDDDDPLNRPAA